VFVQRGDDFMIVGFPLFTLGRNYEGSESEASGSFNAMVSHRVRVRFATTKAATPELIRSIGKYNIVFYDAIYYGIPQALGPRPWGKEDIASLPGVITASTLGEVAAAVERKLGIVNRHAARREKAAATLSSSRRTPGIILVRPVESTLAAKSMPRLIASLKGYNIVEYEGWFYGMPQSLGDIHLDKTDVIELPGIIRDLSREVVEHEIRETVQMR